MTFLQALLIDTTLANPSLEENLSAPAALEEILNEPAALEENLTEPEALGRGLRMRKPPTKLAEYVSTLLHSPYPTKIPFCLLPQASNQFTTKMVLRMKTGSLP